jgi:hypothetical protein
VAAADAPVGGPRYVEMGEGGLGLEEGGRGLLPS